MRFSILPAAGLLTALLLLAPPARGDDALRIGTVDMQLLMKDYHRTADVQEELKVERTRIEEQDKERLETMQALDKELQEMRKQLDDPSLSEGRKQELFKELQIKTQEGMALDRERREFLQRRQAALRERMMMKRRALLGEVRDIVQEHAAKEGYDYVFDRAGMSTSQVPVLLYAKDAVDLTPVLLGKLNEAAPGESETPGPAAPPQ